MSQEFFSTVLKFSQNIFLNVARLFSPKLRAMNIQFFFVDGTAALWSVNLNILLIKLHACSSAAS